MRELRGRRWLPDQVSNLEPPDPESGALPIELSGKAQGVYLAPEFKRRPGIRQTNEPIVAAIATFGYETVVRSVHRMVHGGVNGRLPLGQRHP